MTQLSRSRRFANDSDWMNEFVGSAERILKIGNEVETVRTAGPTDLEDQLDGDFYQCPSNLLKIEF